MTSGKQPKGLFFPLDSTPWKSDFLGKAPVILRAAIVLRDELAILAQRLQVAPHVTSTLSNSPTWHSGTKYVFRAFVLTPKACPGAPKLLRETNSVRKTETIL